VDVSVAVAAHRQHEHDGRARWLGQRLLGRKPEGGHAQKDDPSVVEELHHEGAALAALREETGDDAKAVHAHGRIAQREVFRAASRANLDGGGRRALAGGHPP
jgi:hypothetical protein